MAASEAGFIRITRDIKTGAVACEEWLEGSKVHRVDAGAPLRERPLEHQLTINHL
jgi:hypothetical protein